MSRLTVSTAGETASVDYTIPTAGDEPVKQVSYANHTELRAGMKIPADANLVTWPLGAKYLHEAARTLGANDILVLPERDEPYLIDPRDGFRAAGIVEAESVIGDPWAASPQVVRTPIRNTYSDTGRAANMWFAMVRVTRGLVGMGPRTVIRIADLPFSQPAQKSPPRNVTNPTTEQQRRAWRTDGSVQVLSGVQEKLIESDTANCIVGNFRAVGRSLGGVAFTGIKLMQGGAVRKVNARGFGSGFAGVPNGEAGTFSFDRRAYEVEDVIVDGRDESGEIIIASPIMWNSVPGGRMRDVTTMYCRAGMPALWGSRGVHDWEDVHFLHPAEVGMNSERNSAGLTLNWTRGTISAAAGKYHLIVNSLDGTSQKITLTDVEAKGGMRGDGVLTSHGYNYGGETQGQKAADIVLVRNGVRYPARRDDTGPNRTWGTVF